MSNVESDVSVTNVPSSHSPTQLEHISLDAPEEEELVEAEAEADQPVEAPPQYDPTGRLVRTTPVKATRYDRPRRAQLTHRAVPPGPSELFTQNDRPVPYGWHKMIHPEGQLYFYQPVNRVVTEAYLFDHLILTKISFWMDRVLQLARAQTIELPNSSELFLELDDIDNCCKYYLLNHATRGLFWLDGGTTEELELPGVSSSDHLKLLMEEQYWNHVEYFPNHIKLSPNIENEVRGMLTHAAADAVTSDQSTAPYTFEQSRDFLNLINGLETTPETNAFKNCILGRLMAEMTSSRFVNHSGEGSARLSRNQHLFEEPERRSTRTTRILYALTFSIPTPVEQQLEDLWTDNIAFAVHWRKFIKRKISNWREYGLWGFSIAILNALFLLIPIYPRRAATPIATTLGLVMGLFAELLSLACMIAAIFLIRQHEPLNEAHAVEASGYFDRTRDPISGFKLLGIVYSVPVALLAWAVIFTVLAVATMPWQLAGPVIGSLLLLFIVLLAFVVLTVQAFFHGEKGSWRSSLKWFLTFAWLSRRSRQGYSELSVV